MSRRHLFDSSDGLVVKSLRGLISYNPSLSLIESTRVVFDSEHPRSNVSIISGGGAGHEPAWPGYVGRNLLAASISGDIFASPSTKQVLSAIEAVPSDKGTILCVGNYTGDCLHFGLAAEKANAANESPCALILAGDDVGVGKTAGLVGRRGLAGQLSVLKVMGAAAAAGESFDDCLALGKAMVEQIVSIATTLDHCHVPGRAEHATLDSNEVEIGTGPHNEPGYRKISPVPASDSLIAENLKYLLDEKDPERGYLHFEKSDEVVLLVSNFGGMSVLEMGALVDELLSQLEKDWGMEPVRVYFGNIETSLNAPAFSTSLINITGASRETRFDVERIKEFLDVKTDTAWEAVAGAQTKRRSKKEQIVKAQEEPERTVDASQDIKVDPKLLTSAILSACSRLAAAEFDLTRWDTEMGDGDCGLTLKTGADALTAAIRDNDLAASGSLVTVLHELESILEGKMGGTLGGILGIFFVGVTTALQRGVAEGGNKEASVKSWAQATNEAVESLQRYTPAKEGDRTVMDALIPFARGLEGGDFEEAVRLCREGAEGTRKLRPKLGRATYVGVDEKQKELAPDPGAMGCAIVVEGLAEGLKEAGWSGR